SNTYSDTYTYTYTYPNTYSNSSRNSVCAGKFLHAADAAGHGNDRPVAISESRKSERGDCRLERHVAISLIGSGFARKQLLPRGWRHQRQRNLSVDLLFN